LPLILKDCITAIKKCQPCQIFSRKMRVHPTPLHLVFSISPFAKWGIFFTTCNPSSAAGHHYIIVVVDYFTKWVEAMSTYSNEVKTTTLFLFNHIITRFGIPKSIVIDHGTHFCNSMMDKLTTMPHLDHEEYSPYYPQANGQVESINHILKTMLQQMVRKHKSNWHAQLFSAIWAYRTSAKTAMGFTPFNSFMGWRQFY
jgi:transposase InsO family protein